MTNEPGQDAKTIRPLWIVANLLLTVAVCLLLLVIKNRLSHSHEDSHGNSATPVIVAEDQATRTKDHDVTRGFWSTTRRTSGIQRVSEASQPSGDAGKTALQTPPPPPEGISHSVWGGVIAPVIASASTNFTTAIVGRVTLRGEPPPEVPIDMSASPPCARLQTNSSTTRNFVVSPDGGLADVFVSIVSGLSGKSYTPPRTNLEVVFINCQIQPYVSAAMLGQKLTFKNADTEAHTLQLAKTNYAPRYRISVTSDGNHSHTPTGQDQLCTLLQPSPLAQINLLLV